MSKISKTENITEDTILFTLDVKSLKSNTPKHEGIEAVKKILKPVPKNPIATTVIMSFLFLTLISSNFVFDGIHYLTNPGYAMKTKCAPNYANIFVRTFEKNFRYLYLQRCSIFPCRFIEIYFYSGIKVKYDY